MEDTTNKKETSNPATSNPARVFIGSSATIFVIGAIFWAGATYQRISNIETHLNNIDTAVIKMGDLGALQQSMSDTQRRLDKLEDVVRQLK